MNDKITIEQALESKLPRPWKLTDCSGPPVWKVIRKRPKDLTAELYQRLLAYKIKDGEIRELFHASCLEWAGLKQEKGITKRTDPDEAFTAEDEIPIPYEVIHKPDRPREPTLIDFANGLVAEIGRRDAAIEKINFYVNEIQKIAIGGNTK